MIFSISFMKHCRGYEEVGKRRILLVNRRDRRFDITIPGATGDQEDYVDQTTAFDPPASTKLISEKLTLNGLSVAVVTLP